MSLACGAHLAAACAATRWSCGLASRMADSKMTLASGGMVLLVLAMAWRVAAFCQGAVHVRQRPRIVDNSSTVNE